MFYFKALPLNFQDVQSHLDSKSEGKEYGSVMLTTKLYFVLL
jgi:hypothetical protein